MEKLIEGFMKTVVFVLFFLVFMLAIGSIMALPVMLIWNYMMPELFGAPYLTFWHAFWGTFLLRTFFTNSDIAGLKRPK